MFLFTLKLCCLMVIASVCNATGDGTVATRLHNVQVRNILLEVVLKLVLPPGSQTINMA